MGRWKPFSYDLLPRNIQFLLYGKAIKEPIFKYLKGNIPHMFPKREQFLQDHLNLNEDFFLTAYNGNKIGSKKADILTDIFSGTNHNSGDLVRSKLIAVIEEFDTNSQGMSSLINEIIEKNKMILERWVYDYSYFKSELYDFVRNMHTKSVFDPVLKSFITRCINFEMFDIAITWLLLAAFLQEKINLLKPYFMNVDSLFNPHWGEEDIKDEMYQYSKAHYEKLTGVRGKYRPTLSFEQYLICNVNINGEIMCFEDALDYVNDTSNNVIVLGEGGSGKSTCLIKFWEDKLNSYDRKVIPIFVPLNEYNRKDQQNKFIESYVYENYNIELLEDTSKMNRLLLLDGYNEITINCWSLYEEINELNYTDGIKIVLTSRCGLQEQPAFNDYLVLKMEQLSYEQINDYLGEKDVDDQKYKLFKNPMMLVLYKKLSNSTPQLQSGNGFLFFNNIATCGELIHDWIEMQLYKHFKLHWKKEDFDVLKFYINIILPYIAYSMEREGKYNLYETELERIIETLYSDDNKSFLYDYIGISGYFSKRNIDALFIDQEKINSISNVFSFFLYDYRYSFSHQYFRDYFAAVHILTHGYTCICCKKGLNSEWRELISENVSGMIAGLINGLDACVSEKNKMIPNYRLNGFLLDNIMRTYRGEKCQEGDNALNNIINIKYKQKGGLDGEDLSRLDLRNVNLNTIPLKNIEFDECYVSAKTFFAQGHSMSVTCLCNMSNNVLISGARDGTIRFWDINTNNNIAVLNTNNGWISNVCVSPDEKRIAVAFRNKVVIEYLKSDSIFEFVDVSHYIHPGVVYSLFYCLDSNTIITACSDGIIRYWKCGQERAYKCVKAHDGEATALAISKTGNFFLSGGSDGKVIEWKIENSNRYKEFKGFTRRITCVNYAPEDDYVVASAYEQKVLVWRRINPKNPVLECIGHEKDVLCVVLQKEHIIAGSYDRTVKVWIIPSFLSKKTTQQVSCVRNFERHTSGVTSICSTDSEGIFYTSSFDGTIVKWYIDNDTKEQVIECCRRAGRDMLIYQETLLCATDEGVLKGFNITTGNLEVNIPVHESGIRGIAYNDSNKMLLTASQDGTISFLKRSSSKIWERIKKIQWGTAINCCLFDKNKDYIYFGTDYGEIVSYHIKTNKSTKFPSVHKKGINTVELSRDGKMLVSTSADHSIRIWQIQGHHNFKCMKCLTDNGWETRKAIFVNNIVVFVTWDGKVCEWDYENDYLTTIYYCQDEPLNDIIYDKAKKRYLIASYCEHIIILNTDSVDNYEFWKVHKSAINRIIQDESTGDIFSISRDGIVIRTNQDGKILKEYENVYGLLVENIDLSYAINKDDFTKHDLQILEKYGVTI